MRAQISQWAPWLDGHWTGALAALGAYLAALQLFFHSILSVQCVGLFTS